MEVEGLKVVFDPAQEASKAKRQRKSTYTNKSLFRGSNDRENIRSQHSNYPEKQGSPRNFNSEKEHPQKRKFSVEKEHS